MDGYCLRDVLSLLQLQLLLTLSLTEHKEIRNPLTAATRKHTCNGRESQDSSIINSVAFSQGGQLDAGTEQKHLQHQVEYPRGAAFPTAQRDAPHPYQSLNIFSISLWTPTLVPTVFNLMSQPHPRSSSHTQLPHQPP